MGLGDRMADDDRRGSERVSWLSRLLIEHRDEILRDWVSAIRQLPVANDLARPVLLDDLPHLLDRIAEMAARSDAAPPEPFSTEHAVSRLEAGYDLGEVVMEYALLRECILRRWEEHGTVEARPLDLRILNRAIDYAIAISVERYTATRQRTLQALDRISAAALGSGDMQAFLPPLLLVLAETTPAVDIAAIWLCEGDRVRIAATVGLEEDLAQNLSFAVGEGVVGEVVATGEPMILRTAASDPRVLSRAIRSASTKALYVMPLRDGVRVIGAAELGSRTAYEFSSEDIQLFKAMASRAAAMIQQHQLRAAAESRAAERDAVIESLPDGVFIGSGTQITRVNQVGATMLGYDRPDELVGDVHALARDLQLRDARTGEPIRPEDQPFVVAQQGTPVVRELVVRHRKTGQDLTLRSAAAPIRLGDRIIGAVVVDTDVTDLKRLVREREDFLGMVVHDLRTPLGAIRSLAYVTSRHLEDSGDHVSAQRVRRIDGQVDRMNRLLGDILDRTLAERGRLSVIRGPVDLAALVHDAVEDWRTTTSLHQLVVESPERCVVVGDRDRLIQILNNLLSNAIKYSPSGGRILVRVEQTGDEVLTSIHDQGVGIAPEDRQRIFEPYSRTPAAERGEARGAGLGLFVTCVLVKAHGGRLWVESEVGQGSTFRFSLPRA